MKKLSIIILASISLLLITSCNKNDEPLKTAEEIELYLLESFTVKSESCQINESSCVLSDAPLLKYRDFLSYNPSIYSFKISDDAKAAIENIQLPLTGTAFAITADGEIVYSGYFWSMLSSLSCDWNTISFDMIEFNNAMQVNLAFPGKMEGVDYNDRRNHAVIINTFKRDGKLID